MFPSEWDAVSLALITVLFKTPHSTFYRHDNDTGYPHPCVTSRHPGIHIVPRTPERKILCVISFPHEPRPRASNLTLGHREGPFEEELRRVATVRALDARAPSERVPPEPRNQYCVAMNS